MGEKKLLDGILSALNVCVCVSMFVYSQEYGRFPMWHYVDIHDQLICLTSSLYSQMDPLLEPFSNQPPAPAKPPIFYNFKCLIFGKQITELDWNQSTYGDLLAFPRKNSFSHPADVPQAYTTYYHNQTWPYTLTTSPVYSGACFALRLCSVLKHKFRNGSETKQTY